MGNALEWIADELERLERAGLRRVLAERNGPQGGRAQVAGRESWNFGSNDYLNLASDPRLIAAAKRAADAEGWGAGASPLITGRSKAHAELERRLAEFEGAEGALLFPTGFAANLGVIPALVGEGDALFSDAKNHASLIDGCRASRAQLFVYPHADCGALQQMLRAASGARRRLIVTDSLFSMDGDLAPLDRLAELARVHHAMLLVDEAHATGVFGALGRGAVEHFEALSAGVAEAVSVRVGTLSKALGSVGGFVVGSRMLIDWLTNRARPYVFSTASPPAAAAAALAALEIVRDEPHRRRQLLDRAADLRERLAQRGWSVRPSMSQIIPLRVGEPEAAMRLAARLAEAEVWAPGIRPPTVPVGESLVRISLTWGHGPDAIGGLLEALGEAGG